MSAAVDLATSDRSVGDAARAASTSNPSSTRSSKRSPRAPFSTVEARTDHERESFANDVARRNVIRVVDLLPEQSRTIRDLVRDGRIAIVGAMYDVVTGDLEFLPDRAGDLASDLGPVANGSEVRWAV